MRGDEVVAQGRGEAAGDERGRADDEAVEDDDEPLCCGPERHPREQRDLEAAERGEAPERILRVGTVRREGAMDDLDLPPQAVVVEPGAAAADGGWIGGEERRAERARGGRV